MTGTKYAIRVKLPGTFGEPIQLEKYPNEEFAYRDARKIKDGFPHLSVRIIWGTDEELNNCMELAPTK